MTKPHIAASSYLNAAPLCYSFIGGGQRSLCRFLSDASPARCAELLRDRDADAALIPVIEYQRIPGLLVAPGACVASKRQVRSVILASRVPIERVHRVALDATSRTSAVLTRIILETFNQLQPAYVPASPDLRSMLEINDAALIIGDPAMLIDRRGLKVYDLADEWRRHTGLPIVFAFWAVREDSWASFPGVDFRQARIEGVAHARQIAELYSRSLGLPPDDLLHYLTENIDYDLDEENLRGLALYYESAEKLGVVQGLRELRFL